MNSNRLNNRLTPANPAQVFIPRVRLVSGRQSRLHVVSAIKRSSLKNIVCSKTLVAKDDKSYLKLSKFCKELANHAQKEMQDKEKGILAFEVFQDRYESNQIHFWERYVDNVRLGRFNSSDKYMKFMENIQPYTEGPVGMALYEWRDGLLGSPCVQGGPKGEGGLDDATGATGMSGGANYKQTTKVLGTLPKEEERDEQNWFQLPWMKKSEK